MGNCFTLPKSPPLTPVESPLAAINRQIEWAVARDDPRLCLRLMIHRNYLLRREGGLSVSPLLPVANVDDAHKSDSDEQGARSSGSTSDGDAETPWLRRVELSL